MMSKEEVAEILTYCKEKGAITCRSLAHFISNNETKFL